MAYRRRWLPLEDDTEDSWATALYLEQRYWDNMANAVGSGISKVF